MHSSIYAPVPLEQVSAQMAHQLRASATEVWVSRVPSPSTRVSCYDTGNERPLYDLWMPLSVGPIHLKDETC